MGRLRLNRGLLRNSIVMLLSVVIPVYNERDTLLEIIQRVLAVPLEIDRELVLVDDCSTDGTRANPTADVPAIVVRLCRSIASSAAPSSRK